MRSLLIVLELLKISHLVRFYEVKFAIIQLTIFLRYFCFLCQMSCNFKVKQRVKINNKKPVWKT